MSRKNIFYTWSVFAFVYLIVAPEITCYPVDKLSTDIPIPEAKDETRYPNGTVVGKYTYTDNEGNPIHVKYYADDASYGVELQSIKVLDTSTSSTNTATHTDEQNWPSNFDTLKPIDHPFGTSELLNSVKQKTNKPKEKENAYKAKSSEYETFYQNDINSPQECGKDKVRVYLNKEKRIIKRALDNYQAARYCERF